MRLHWRYKQAGGIPMKNLKIFGDSIIKGVTYNGQSA